MVCFKYLAAFFWLARASSVFLWHLVSFSCCLAACLLSEYKPQDFVYPFKCFYHTPVWSKQWFDKFWKMTSRNNNAFCMQNTARYPWVWLMMWVVVVRTREASFCAAGSGWLSSPAATLLLPSVPYGPGRAAPLPAPPGGVKRPCQVPPPTHSAPAWGVEKFGSEWNKMYHYKLLFL